MTNPTMTLQQRKERVKKLSVLYARTSDALHKLEAEMKSLGFSPQGKQIRKYKDDMPWRELGRDREPTSGWS